MNTILLISLALIGIIDASYLTYTHFVPSLLPCPANGFIDCGKVTGSPYSEILGIPIAAFGVLFYVVVLVLLLAIKAKRSLNAKKLLVLFSWAGFAFSIYLVYLQLVVIGAVCIYCMLSAVTSTLIFFVTNIEFKKARNSICLWVLALIYINIIKRIFFAIDPETVHEFMLKQSDKLGGLSVFKKFAQFFMVNTDKSLLQKIASINFATPVGMAAGFDYEAKTTQVLGSLGFGMMTVGTITNMPYEGNPKPRLGRLPKSKSLLVNKGFKNDGVVKIAERLSGMEFDIPIGVSVGRSNSMALTNQKDSIADIVKTFKVLEKSKLNNSFYELNISCPNLIHGRVEFYSPKNLHSLLVAIDSLKLKKPVFIKMPIEKGNSQVLAMLKVIAKHKVAGVIFGNLQKDRNNKTLLKEEVIKFKVGYYSGKATFDRSNELIKLAYKNFGKRLVIIGCGGVFNAKDAYTKIKLGASLVQLITGLIYEGPQLIAQINLDLPELLAKDGYKHVSEAIGVDVK